MYVQVLDKFCKPVEVEQLAGAKQEDEKSNKSKCGMNYTSTPKIVRVKDVREDGSIASFVTGNLNAFFDGWLTAQSQAAFGVQVRNGDYVSVIIDKWLQATSYNTFTCYPCARGSAQGRQRSGCVRQPNGPPRPLTRPY